MCWKRALCIVIAFATTLAFGSDGYIPVTSLPSQVDGAAILSAQIILKKNALAGFTFFYGTVAINYASGAPQLSPGTAIHGLASQVKNLDSNLTWDGSSTAAKGSGKFQNDAKTIQMSFEFVSINAGQGNSFLFYFGLEDTNGTVVDIGSEVVSILSPDQHRELMEDARHDHGHLVRGPEGYFTRTDKYLPVASLSESSGRGHHTQNRTLSISIACQKDLAPGMTLHYLTLPYRTEAGHHGYVLPRAGSRFDGLVSDVPYSNPQLRQGSFSLEGWFEVTHPTRKFKLRFSVRHRSESGERKFLLYYEVIDQVGNVVDQGAEVVQLRH